MQVLVLEDNPVARGFLSRVVRESFSDAGTVHETGDVLAARELLRDPAATGGDPLQLVLVDLELPQDSGLRLLGELAGHTATKVVTTLFADDEHLFPALQLGADGYLLKEDRFEVVVEGLQRIARGQPPLSPAIARRILGYFRQGDARHSDSGFLSTSGFPSSRPAAVDTGGDAARLNSREVELLTYLSKGFTPKEIASLMAIRWTEVHEHIRGVYRKLRAPVAT